MIDMVVEESQQMSSLNIAKNKIKTSMILEQENRSCKTQPLYLAEWAKLNDTVSHVRLVPA